MNAAPLRRTPRLVAAAFAIALAASTTAFAGECPPDQRRPAGNGQPMSAAPAVGVKDKVITSIALADEPVKIGGRLLRGRKLEIAPGGVVPWHSHADRPALLFVSQGEITEYASTCATPIVHKVGEITAERNPTAHWWKNHTDKPVVIHAFDLFHVDDKPNEHMM